jgi:hypothetical protein
MTKARKGVGWGRFLGALAKFRKATIRSVMSARPSLPMEQLCSHWTDLREISHWSIFRKSVEKCQVSLMPDRQRLRWSRGSVLAFSTQVRGYKPGRSRRIFKGEKILGTPSFGGEVKPSVPCRRFAACKRFLNVAI